METRETGLREKIRALVKQRETTRTLRRSERDQQMAELEGRIARFRELEERWINEIILPRLRALAESFPNSEVGSCREGERCCTVRFEPTHEYPVEAKVDAWTSPDPDARKARVTFRVTIVPILGNFERQGIVEIDIAEPDTGALVRFLDERILRFADDYLNTTEPDSPYQVEAKVTDPVCGMVLLRTEASSRKEYDGRTWYFCVEACRRKFEGDPERYAKLPVRG